MKFVLMLVYQTSTSENTLTEKRNRSMCYTFLPNTNSAGLRPGSPFQPSLPCQLGGNVDEVDEESRRRVNPRFDVGALEALPRSCPLPASGLRSDVNSLRAFLPVVKDGEEKDIVALLVVPRRPARKGFA